MNDIYQYKDFEILCGEFKDIDGRKGIVTGYFADFGSVDSDGDVIMKGAFTKTISESGPGSKKPRIKHLLNHDYSQPLGVLTTLKEDNKGLGYESQLGTHALGSDFVKMADSGLITEHSIGYRAIKFNQVTPWSDWKQGEIARELTELKLWEGSSLTAWGANPNTPLTGLKSEQKIEKIGKRMDLLIKALRNGTFTDETFDLLEIELKQLQQLYIDLSKGNEPQTSTQEPPKSTQPMQPMAMCPNCKTMNPMPSEDEPMMTCKDCGTSYSNPRRKKSRSWGETTLTSLLN